MQEETLQKDKKTAEYRLLFRADVDITYKNRLVSRAFANLPAGRDKACGMKRYFGAMVCFY